MARPAMRYNNQLQEPHGRAHFANSDLASDRAGSVEGAIEPVRRANETSNALLGTAEVHRYSNALRLGTP